MLVGPAGGFIGITPKIGLKAITAKQPEILKKLKILRIITFSFFFVLI
jgi:hypothetical protein